MCLTSSVVLLPLMEPAVLSTYMVKPCAENVTSVAVPTMLEPYRFASVGSTLGGTPGTTV